MKIHSIKHRAKRKRWRFHASDKVKSVAFDKKERGFFLELKGDRLYQVFISAAEVRELHKRLIIASELEMKEVKKDAPPR